MALLLSFYYYPRNFSIYCPFWNFSCRNTLIQLNLFWLLCLYCWIMFFVYDSFCFLYLQFILLFYFTIEFPPFHFFCNHFGYFNPTLTKVPIWILLLKFTFCWNRTHNGMKQQMVLHWALCSILYWELLVLKSFLCSNFITYVCQVMYIVELY